MVKVSTFHKCFLICWFLFQVVFFLSPVSVQAEVIRYSDDEGVVHYVDSLEDVPDKYRDQSTDSSPLPPLGKITAPDYGSMYPTPVQGSERHYQKKKVQILVASWCGYCRSLEEFLKGKHIKYERYDIETSSKGRDMYSQLAEPGVPVTLVGNKMIKGYRPGEIEEALGD